MKIVLVTGGFDPIHSGHIAYFKSARALGDMLIVGLNSDEWLERKKGRAFMPWNERLCIINNLAMVDEVYTFNDEDDSARHFIQQARAHYPEAELIFANGGDRTAENIPEMSESNIEFVFGVGGTDKANSSSWILDEWKNQKTNRSWGFWRVLLENNKTKTKELTVEPGQKLSMQRHHLRSEFWFITQGHARVHWENSYTDLTELETIKIDRTQWHQLENIGQIPLCVVEIQHGIQCDESDIERK
jgi:D-beta-D-heptose 7-phosphate kinase/D-beta-D-heptose 1-phosphate adenosyltransferase